MRKCLFGWLQWRIFYFTSCLSSICIFAIFSDQLAFCITVYMILFHSPNHNLQIFISKAPKLVYVPSPPSFQNNIFIILSISIIYKQTHLAKS